jgi:hypothetical protein
MPELAPWQWVHGVFSAFMISEPVLRRMIAAIVLLIVVPAEGTVRRHKRASSSS